MAMASVRVRPMTVDDATHVSSWRYPHRWSVYDLQSSIDILDELDLYRSVTDADGTLIGFFCLESAARVHGMSADPEILDVGVGMDPCLVGHGSGRAFGEVVLDHLGHEYPGRPLRAVIQSWNLRSRRFAASLGFVDVGELARSPCSQQESYRVLLKPHHTLFVDFVHRQNPLRDAPTSNLPLGGRESIVEFAENASAQDGDGSG